MAVATDAAVKERPKPRLATLLFGDFLVTALWVLASSCFAEASAYFAKYTNLDELLLGIAITVAALAVFGPLCGLFGGALFNPVNSIALVCSGKGSLPSHIIRMIGQLAGALAGTVAARVFLPDYLQGKFSGLSGGIREGVAFELGFACEGTLSLVLNYVFLQSLDANSRLLDTWAPMISTVILSWIGFYFTGPSLNPFVSFSWHYHYQQQDQMEHWLVFWSAPILGAAAAGLAYRRLGAAAAGPKEARREGEGKRSRRPSKAAIAARKAQTAAKLARKKQH